MDAADPQAGPGRAWPSTGRATTELLRSASPPNGPLPAPAPRPLGLDGACLRVLPGPLRPAPSNAAKPGAAAGLQVPSGSVARREERNVCLVSPPWSPPSVRQDRGVARHPALHPGVRGGEGNGPPRPPLLGRGEREGQAARTTQQHTKEDPPAVSARGSPNPTPPHSSRSTPRPPGPWDPGSDARGPLFAVRPAVWCPLVTFLSLKELPRVGGWREGWGYWWGHDALVQNSLAPRRCSVTGCFRPPKHAGLGKATPRPCASRLRSAGCGNPGPQQEDQGC